MPNILATSWEDLPLKHGEDSVEWNNLMARYGHQACPGTGEDTDVCVHPWDCASKGRCRLNFGYAQAAFSKDQERG